MFKISHACGCMENDRILFFIINSGENNPYFNPPYYIFYKMY